MSYPLIIVGAGASYDYIDPTLVSGHKPPLTDHLFKKEYLDYGLIEKYPGLDGLISSIAPKINNGGEKTLEEIMGTIGDARQLVALKFYLSDFFKSISNGYRGVNNYAALRDKIEHGSGGQACIVSFNYDTLLDKALGMTGSTSTGVYIRGGIQLIKVHGSCDWYYVHRKHDNDRDRGIRGPFDAMYLGFEPSSDNEICTEAQLDQFDVQAEYYRLPVIAIPTNSTKKFACPEAHINALINSLGKIDRILIIGWKAGDEHMVKLLEQYVNQPVQITIVAGTERETLEIQERLGRVRHAVFNKGVVEFSNFLRSHREGDFFA